MKYAVYINLFLIGIGMAFFSLPLKHSKAKEQPKSLREVFSTFEEKIRYIKLNNGLRLILMKRGFAPVVAAYIKFKVGSYDEGPQSFGIAHMLEHMLFKGTRKVGTRNFGKEKKYLTLGVRFAAKLDMWRRHHEAALLAKDSQKIETTQKQIDKYKRLMRIIDEQSRPYIISEEDSYIYALQGARGYNAYTNSDMTNYQVEIPVHRLEVWARLEADRMQNAVLRRFYTERDVVQEERRMRVDNSPHSSLWEKFRQEVYGSHPYGHSVIGPMKSITYLNYHQAMDFYQTHYTPSNTVIALVGNINIKHTEKLVRQYFGSIPNRTRSSTSNLATTLHKKVTKPRPRQLRVQVRKGASPLMYLAWFKPPMPDADDLYLGALSSILAGSPETRLYQRLVVKEKLAANVFAYSSAVGNRATNLFVIRVQPLPGTSLKILDTIEKITLEELQKVRTHGVKQEELHLVRRRERLDIIKGLQSNSFLADMLSRFEVITGSYRDLFGYNELLDTIQPQDVQRAALSYLKPKYTMTARLVPEEKTKETTPSK